MGHHAVRVTPGWHGGIVSVSYCNEKQVTRLSSLCSTSTISDYLSVIGTQHEQMSRCMKFCDMGLVQGFSNLIGLRPFATNLRPC